MGAATIDLGGAGAWWMSTARACPSRTPPAQERETYRLVVGNCWIRIPPLSQREDSIGKRQLCCSEDSTCPRTRMVCLHPSTLYCPSQLTRTLSSAKSEAKGHEGAQDEYTTTSFFVWYAAIIAAYVDGATGCGRRAAGRRLRLSGRETGLADWLGHSWYTRKGHARWMNGISVAPSRVEKGNKLLTVTTDSNNIDHEGLTSSLNSSRIRSSSRRCRPVRYEISSNIVTPSKYCTHLSSVSVYP